MRAFLSQYSRAFRDHFPRVYSLRRVETESRFMRTLYASLSWFCVQLDSYSWYTQKFALTRPLSCWRPLTSPNVPPVLVTFTMAAPFGSFTVTELLDNCRTPFASSFFSITMRAALSEPRRGELLGAGTKQTLVNSERNAFRIDRIIQPSNYEKSSHKPRTPRHFLFGFAKWCTPKAKARKQRTKWSSVDSTTILWWTRANAFSGPGQITEQRRTGTRGETAAEGEGVG